MKPNFALSLSFEGISLFHRTERGWHLVGEVALESADFAGELETLRKTAKALDNRGLATKLILPNDQIRYLDVETGKVGDEARIAGARAALDGATPYSVDELAISASAHGPITHVAAVAHETLREAESFALEHRFNPVCFVAVPENGSYLGEPFFGLTANAASLPDGGAGIGPEKHPVRATGKVEPLAEPEPAPAAEPKPKPAEAKPAKASAQPKPADKAAEPAPKKPAKAEPAPSPSFHTSRSASDAGADVSAPRLSGVSRLTIGTAQAAADAPAPAVADLDPTPPATPGFAPEPAEAQPQTSAMDRLRGAAAPLRGLGAKLPKKLPSVSLPKRRRDDAPELAPGAADVAVAETAVAAAPAAADMTEARRMTVFGARDAQPIGGKPRYLGLILTLLLLLFLAAVAAWASIFTDEGIAGLFRRSEPAVVEVVSLPEEPVANEEALADEPEVAATDAITDSAEVEAQLETGPAELTDREAEAHYAVTGIWLMGPEQPEPAIESEVDSLYIASIDSRISAQDAVLIPVPDPVRRDTDPRSLAPPAAAGTTFTFDDRGLVVATSDGAVTPDGITVYKGRPAAVPPQMPDRSAIAEATPEAIAERLAQVRPRPRPGNLAENTERARNGGLTLAELAGKRPKARPATAKFELEQDQTPTAQAVAVSRIPKPRPENFAAIVELATAQQTEEQDEEVVQAAAAPAPVAAPTIPTTASVARQATVKNVINLRKVNLIGVYGKPTSRRALVRLANGSYKKVQVGDRIDGGKVSAIGEDELHYTKSGRSVVLKMPKT